MKKMLINRMISRLKSLTEGRFAKNIIMIAGGTAVAQLLNIITSPVLTRIYTPEEFGLLTIYTSLLNIFAGSQSFRYELAIPIADDDESAINIVTLSFIIVFILTTILSMVLFLWGEELLSIFSARPLMKYRLLIPIGFLLYGTYQIMMMWNFRFKNFKAISTTKVAQSISGTITKLLLGIMGLGPIGLILGKIIGESAGIHRLSESYIKREKKSDKKHKINNIIEVSKRYFHFPLYSLPSTFMNKFASQLPILFIAYFYGEGSVGHFGFALSIVSLPMTLIGTSVGDVFYGEAANIGKTAPFELLTLSKKIFKKLVAVGSLPFIFLVLFSPQLFQFVFGYEWYIAGEYARLLAFLSFAQLVFQPVSRIYDIYEKQKALFLITVLRISLVSIAFVFSTLLHAKITTVISLYIAIMILVYAVTYLYGNRIITIEINKLNNKNVM